MDDAGDGVYSRAPELEDLLSLCQALNREQARYVLIGGFAVILHGFVRGTKDIDLLVDPEKSNVQARREVTRERGRPSSAAVLMSRSSLHSRGGRAPERLSSCTRMIFP